MDHWHIKVFAQFGSKIYSESLTHAHILEDGKEHFIQELIVLEYGVKEKYKQIPEKDRFVVYAKKSGVNYVFPVHMVEKLPLVLKDDYLIKCQIKQSDNTVWKWIHKPVHAKLPELKLKDFRSFIDDWNPKEVSSKETDTLLKLIAFASIYKPLKVCVCSNPEAGKSINFSLLSALFDDVAIIHEPTKANFHNLCCYNQCVVVEETTSTPKTSIGDIETTVNMIGDVARAGINKSSITDKRSNARINLNKLSLVFLYNTLKNVKENKGIFFDEFWNNPAAIQSKYPQLLIEGKVITGFKNYNESEAKEIVANSYTSLQEIAAQSSYWRKHLHEYKHNYDTGFVSKLPSRHKTNLEALFDVCDVYSNSQDEFNEWLLLILNCITAYKNMLNEWKYKDGKLE